MRDLSSFIDERERAPRLNELSDFLAATANERSAIPVKQPKIEFKLLDSNHPLKSFIRLHKQRGGPFDQHYHASIPYRFEEECRLGYTVLRYCQSLPGTSYLYSLGTAEGTMERAICELADGQVDSCSPNLKNYNRFLAYGRPPHATFFVGPFHHLVPDLTL